jgi:DNA-binding LytR/AlgR family response regulator
MIRKIAIPTLEGIILLPMSELVRIETMGSYAVLYLSSSKKITASRPIGEFQDMLPDTTFFRTHKSHIVNLNCVERYVRGEDGSVILQDGTEIRVSRTAKTELLSRLQVN